MRSAALGAAVAMFCALPGCGTMVAWTDRPAPYGGVRLDACGPALLAQAAIPALREEHDKFSPGTNALLGACMVADLPFSAVADTLTLPVTVPAALAQRREKREPPPETADPSAKPFAPP
jgi:uncharacterized protein YceK